MTQEPTQTTFEELDSLLEAERTALLKGDLEALAEMLPRKEALIEALNNETVEDLPALQALGARVERNQLLLNGALEGIREVAARMASLRRMRSGLETYGSDGVRKHIEVQIDHSLERRA